MTGKNSAVTGKFIEPSVIMTGIHFKLISKPAYIHIYIYSIHIYIYIVNKAQQADQVANKAQFS